MGNNCTMSFIQVRSMQRLGKNRFTMVITMRRSVVALCVCEISTYTPDQITNTLRFANFMRVKNGRVEFDISLKRKTYNSSFFMANEKKNTDFVFYFIKIKKKEKIISVNIFLYQSAHTHHGMLFFQSIFLMPSSSR